MQLMSTGRSGVFQEFREYFVFSRSFVALEPRYHPGDFVNIWRINVDTGLRYSPTGSQVECRVRKGWGRAVEELLKVFGPSSKDSVVGLTQRSVMFP